MTRFSAIIFDMDGTLINTVGHIERAYAQTMKAFGISKMSSSEFHALYERNVKTVDYLEHFGIDPKHTEDFRAQRDEYYVEVLKTQSSWMEDAEEVLNELFRDFPLGLATGAQHQYIDAINERLGILRYIKAVACADDDGYKRKPDPFLLLRAANLLGVEPVKTLYVGDQITDLRAARMANMSCCLVTDMPIAEADIQSEKIIRHLRELPQYLSQTE